MKKQILNIKLTRATKNGNYPKIIYKYLTLNSALKLLQNNTLLFSNPAAWQEPLREKSGRGEVRRGWKDSGFPSKRQSVCGLFYGTIFL